jgi:high-affinity iron transporter
MRCGLLLTCVVGCVPPMAWGSEVSGWVAMPEACSPAVSPAVVMLEPLDRQEPAASAEAGKVALVRQSGLMFVPRVQAVGVGQVVTITNEDRETHSVHNIGSGNHFNLSMGPGERREVVAETPGVLKLVCDIHGHMRAFVVVSRTPWFAVGRGDGSFRITGVPEGRYRLRVWHELGEELRKEVEVSGKSVALGTLTVSGPSSDRQLVLSGRARPWSEVIDRIGVTLAASLAAARRPEGLKAARKLAEDAYWGEFEASGMETAIRGHLGFERAGDIEGQFRALRAALKGVTAHQTRPSQVADLQRALIAGLVRAADELNRKGITDASKNDLAAIARGVGAAAHSADEHQFQRAALEDSLNRVRMLADRNEPDEAASAMTDAYFVFEPMETTLVTTSPLAVTRLEARFNALRGEVGAGVKGQALADRLANLRAEIDSAFQQRETPGWGVFGTAFAASLITILREGVEVILLLTMLIALVAKTGRARDLVAIRRGVVLAMVASVITAAGLNLVLASARGRTREQLEGLVLLLAAGVLFYVSYWLVSQIQAKRWTDFLKRQATHAAEIGSAWTLGLTAFLAVYREGAETALMYQALIAGQPARLGQIGLGLGLGLGLVLLGIVYKVIRSASVRLPLKAFFQVSGMVLFTMAVVFAGKGVAELQNSGLVRITPVSWLGQGLPALGFYPNVQTLSVQGLLLVGAVLALLLLIIGARSAPVGERVPIGGSMKAKVGV